MLFDELYSMDLPLNTCVLISDGDRTVSNYLYSDEIRAYRYRHMKAFSRRGDRVIVTMEAD